MGRDRSNMLQKGLGMLTTVINLHFICSVQVSAFLITVTLLLGRLGVIIKSRSEMFSNGRNFHAAWPDL